jgi:hypothetical protein
MVAIESRLSVQDILAPQSSNKRANDCFAACKAAELALQKVLKFKVFCNVLGTPFA